MQILFTLLFSFLSRAETLELYGDRALQFTHLLKNSFNITCEQDCNMKLDDLTCQIFSKGYDLKQCAAKAPAANGQYVIVYSQDQQALLLRNFLIELGLSEEEFETGGIIHKSLQVQSIECHLLQTKPASCQLVW